MSTGPPFSPCWAAQLYSSEHEGFLVNYSLLSCIAFDNYRKHLIHVYWTVVVTPQPFSIVVEAHLFDQEVVTATHLIKHVQDA